MITNEDKQVFREVYEYYEKYYPPQNTEGYWTAAANEMATLLTGNKSHLREQLIIAAYEALAKINIDTSIPKEVCQKEGGEATNGKRRLGEAVENAD